MARLLRKPKKRNEALTDAMLDELVHGPGCVLDHDEPTYPLQGEGPTIYSVFESPRIARATWLAFRELIEAECEPLERAWAWWAFEQRDPEAAYARDEAERLEALGVLSLIERGLLEARRPDAAERAADIERWNTEYEALKRARSGPGAVVAIEDRTMRVPNSSTRDSESGEPRHLRLYLLWTVALRGLRADVLASCRGKQDGQDEQQPQHGRTLATRRRQRVSP